MLEVVDVPVESVARAVRWWVPSGAFFHTASKGAEVTSPTCLSSAKKTTEAMVAPSWASASARKVMSWAPVSEVCTASIPGAVSLTTGLAAPVRVREFR